MAELSDFRLHRGDPAPDFTLPGVDGRSYRLADFHQDRLLVVAFWCNHCPYVQAWEGRMIELARATRDRGVGFVLINSNDAASYPDDSFPRMVERARQKGYPFPYLWDEDQAVARAYGALVTPHPFLFGPDRRLLFQGRIDDRHDEPSRVRERYLAQAIDQALLDRPIARPELPVLGCSVKWKA
ncbi:MAG TPA: thioredoxin family protein [Thermoplasmata archaeon]|nr:thioredoxin family protein [Thermoplasmata archaeon]